MPMRDYIASALSILFSPFLVPVVTILIIVQRYAATGQQALLWTTIIIVFVSVLPVLFILFLFRVGQLSDLHLAVREQRIGPLLFSMASAFVGTGILQMVGAPREIVWAGIAYVVNGVLFTMITPYWKISFHSGVTAGCITVLVLLIRAKFGWLFLLLPPIAWARVRRKRHTPLQTVVGVLISVVSTIVVFQLSGIGLGISR